MRADDTSGFLPGFVDTPLAAAHEATLFQASRAPGVTQCTPVSSKKASRGSRSANSLLASSPFTSSLQSNSQTMERSVTSPEIPFGLYHGDAVEWLRTLPSSSVDLLITDPPYESLEKHRAVGTTTRLKHSKASSNDWFQIFPNARFAELFSEVYRVLARNSHFYLFCDAETMFVAKPIAEQCGFRFWKPLVWDKQKIGMGYHYRARYEFVLFFEKGKRKLNDLGIPDIIEAPRIRNGYPTEKPVYVSEVLVRQSSARGELVVDPFMGSASVGEAALRHERRFMGSDVSENAVSLSRARLAGLIASNAGA